MKANNLALLVALVASIHAGNAFGQASEISAIAGDQNDSTLNRESETVRRAIEIKTGKDSSGVSLKIGGALSDSLAGSSGAARFSAWSLTAAAPIDKKKTNTELATLDGLSDSFSVEWKYNRFYAQRKNPFSNAADTTLNDAICDETKALFIQKRLDAAGPNEDEVRVRRAANAAWLCDQFNVKTLLSRRYTEFRSLYWDLDANKTLWGVAVKAGYEEFSYLNPADGAKQNTDKAPWSAKLYYGWIPAGSQSLFVVGAEYQKAYKNAEAQTLCQPPDTNGIQTCQTGSIGRPLNNDKELLFVEWRGHINLVPKQPAGVSIRLTHDFKANKFGIDVPVFLWKDKDSKLTGGLQFGWTSDPGDLSLGIIVGSSFTITDKY